MTTTTTTPTNGAGTTSFDPVRSPIRVLDDAHERWISPKAGAAMTWSDARTAVREHAIADGRRADIGAGALDRLAVDFDRTGLLHVVKTSQKGGEIVPASGAMPIRKAAFSQLCERAGNAPASYLSKLPAKLTRACLMHGLTSSDAPTGGLIRLADGQARAIVSGRYAALDDEIVLDTLERALLDRGLLGTIQVRGVALGTTTVVRLTWSRDAIEVKRGDIVESGIDITNGEIGNRSVGITPSLYRLVCLNGMRSQVPGIARRFNHVGDPARLFEAFRDAIPVAVEEAMGNANRLRESVDAMISDVDAEFGGLGVFGLTAAEGRAVTRQAMVDRGLALPEATNEWPEVLRQLTDVSAFEVLNGMTAFAQTRGTDRRLEIEEAAGRYLHARTR